MRFLFVLLVALPLVVASDDQKAPQSCSRAGNYTPRPSSQHEFNYCPVPAKLPHDEMIS